MIILHCHDVRHVEPILEAIGKRLAAPAGTSVVELPPCAGRNVGNLAVHETHNSRATLLAIDGDALLLPFLVVVDGEDDRRDVVVLEGGRQRGSDHGEHVGDDVW
jgi:hypothetical protein